MTVIRKGSVATVVPASGYPGPYNLGQGHLAYAPLSDAGGLTQFGAAWEVLQPGGQSSQMHWHEREDEFLLMLDGSLTVIEDGVETEIGPGDACAWKAGSGVAHCLKNRSDRPATYLIVGTRHPEEICHYPGLDLRDTPQGYVHLDGTPWGDTAKG
jgi:uncharacterized cupin superfamily protein